VNFPDGLVQEGVSGGSGVKPDGEENGLKFLVTVGEFERSVARFDTSVAESSVSAVVEIRAPVIFRLEKVVGPAQDFFYGGNEVFLVHCEVSEGIRDVFNFRSRGGGGAEKVGCGELGNE
jgi:hypothetical protein